MIKTIQVKLPGEIGKLFDDLKEVRNKNFEPTSYTSIVMDAVKAYHQQRVSK
ncbi:hypothetical protein [Fibrobacter sp. UWH9]|uniref:hypothetical protein n=1 Tax=Fibrobacter sp. UWH9 TaxID=1896213 RepID=UPI001C31BAAF|nr:hypothetical protein [Fibrobacter sp. UWH9]